MLKAGSLVTTPRVTAEIYIRQDKNKDESKTEWRQNYSRGYGYIVSKWLTHVASQKH